LQDSINPKPQSEDIAEEYPRHQPHVQILVLEAKKVLAASGGGDNARAGGQCRARRNRCACMVAVGNVTAAEVDDHAVYFICTTYDFNADTSAT
jgi:hypothetical protein